MTAGPELSQLQRLELRAGMTRAEKFRTPYSAEDLALLVRLRAVPEPLTWCQIRDRYFPMRTAEALKNKHAELTRGQRARGRPKGSKAGCHEDDGDAGESNRFEAMCRQGTHKLGLAISRLLMKQSLNREARS